MMREEKTMALDAIEKNLDRLVLKALKRNLHYQKHLLNISGLKARLKNESVLAASSFIDERSAQIYTYHTLKNNVMALNRWLSSAYTGERATFSWTYFEKVVGIGLFRDDELVYGTRKCSVVVQKTDNCYEFDIITSMPRMDERYKIEI